MSEIRWKRGGMDVRSCALIGRMRRTVNNEKREVESVRMDRSRAAVPVLLASTELSLLMKRTRRKPEGRPFQHHTLPPTPSDLLDCPQPHVCLGID